MAVNEIRLCQLDRISAVSAAVAGPKVDRLGQRVALPPLHHAKADLAAPIVRGVPGGRSFMLGQSADPIALRIFDRDDHSGEHHIGGLEVRVDAARRHARTGERIDRNEHREECEQQAGHPGILA
jgi:hypothetical protein